MKIFFFKSGILHDSRTGSYVSYLDHLKALAEKDALIKSLTERVVKYMAQYPNGASGCSCLFDDNDVPILSCSYHAEKNAEIADLKKDLALNASMLAKQCDLTRESKRQLDIIGMPSPRSLNIPKSGHHTT